MGSGEVGGNGSVEWSIRHSPGPGGQGQAGSAGGDGKDQIGFNDMRKNPTTGLPSFRVKLKGAVAVVNQPDTFEVPVDTTGASGPKEIKIEW